MAAGNAVGGHRTLNKTDSPFVPVSHRALAVRTGTRNAYFDRNEGERSWLEKHIPNQAIRRRAMEF
jgi:hypothetical protein